MGKRLFYETPVVRRTFTLCTAAVGLLAGSKLESAPTSVGHEVGEEIGYESRTTFNHEWN